MSDEGLPQLAKLLNHLFATVPRAPGQPLHTNESAAAAMNAAGYSVTAVYLGQLRSGKRTNPSAKHLAGIAQLFGVPIDYFFNPTTTDRINAELELLVAMRDTGVRNLALRANGLSEDSLEGLTAIINHIRELEQQRQKSDNADDPPT